MSPKKNQKKRKKGAGLDSWLILSSSKESEKNFASKEASNSKTE